MYVGKLIFQHDLDDLDPLNEGKLFFLTSTEHEISNSIYSNAKLNPNDGCVESKLQTQKELTTKTEQIIRRSREE
jgi:hypothetical protein